MGLELSCSQDFGIGKNRTGINWDEIYNRTLKEISKNPKAASELWEKPTQTIKPPVSNPFELDADAKKRFDEEVKKINSQSVIETGRGQRMTDENIAER